MGDIKKDKKDKKDKKEKKGDKSEKVEAEYEECMQTLTELDVLFRDANNQSAFAKIRTLDKADAAKALKKHIKSLSSDAQAMINNHLAHKKKRDAMKVDLSAIDWADLESIQTSWPDYIRAQLESEKRNQTLRRGVEIEEFDLRIPYSQTYLFKQSSLKLEAGKRYCLHSEPGAGKSTLFTAIAAGSGEGGLKGFPNHLHVHLCQEIEISSDAQPVRDTVVNSFAFLNVLRANRKMIAARILAYTGKTVPVNTNDADAVSEVADVAATATPKDGEVDALYANLRIIDQRLDSLGNRDAEDRASKMLRVLGFDEEMQTRSTNALSGGQRMRVALCASFFMEPDLLLLDEPTNHLDFPSVLWLENRMRAYRKTLLLVSHERDMLERVCTGVIDISKKQLHYFNMGFIAFEHKVEEDEKKMAETVEKFLLRNRNVDSASPLARQKKEYQEWQDEYYAKQIRLQGKFTFPPAVPLEPFVIENAQENPVEDPENAPKPEEAPKKVVKKKSKGEDEEIDLSTLPRSDIGCITKVRFSYNPGVLPWIFDEPISFSVQYSPNPTRVGVMGPNGAGKSTFMKLLLGRLTPTTGTVERNTKVKIGYFAQHHAAELDMDLTPMEYMQQQFPDELSTGNLRKHLGKVGVTGQLAETRMKTLTHGQRSCVMFAKITYDCPHLLVMDEPTNFLDLASIDSLISATNKFKGALLLVSHNRGFLLRCAKQYLSIVPGQFQLFHDLKACEQSTYTFIQELEAGNSVSAKDLVANINKHTTDSHYNADGSKTADNEVVPE